MLSFEGNLSISTEMMIKRMLRVFLFVLLEKCFVHDKCNDAEKYGLYDKF